MKKILRIFSIILILALPVNLIASADSSDSPLGFRMKTIDGLEMDLSIHKGKVILMVNVASKCGLTPQYEALQRIYEKYKGQGFVIFGFPANNFRNQEPGTNEEIRQFCTLNYGVNFPLFAKISVSGEDQHPLYEFLTGKTTNPEFGGEIKWNFTKFLIGRDGQVIARFEPRTTPDSPEVTSAIETALKK
jgi:glutathione peroxidase